MKYILLISLLCLCKISNAQKRTVHEQDMPPVVKYYLWNDKSPRNVFLTFDKKRDYYIFNKNCKPYNLSISEIAQIEKIIIERVNKYNKGRQYEIIKRPEKYYKQFIAVVNSKGEKEIWVNCSCQILENTWKKYPQSADDGGSCYFQMKINLTKKLVYDFGVNGGA